MTTEEKIRAYAREFGVWPENVRREMKEKVPTFTCDDEVYINSAHRSLTAEVVK